MDTNFAGCNLNGSRSVSEDTSSSDGSLDLEKQVVLRVECISKLSVKRFAFWRFCLKYVSICTWIVCLNFTFTSVLYNREGLDLHLATAVSTVILAFDCAALAILLHRVAKVSRAQQHWSQPRLRLAGIALVQLICLVGANLFFLASSAVANRLGCNSTSSFCKWSHFLQWTCWNTLICTQLVMTHSACVWTNSEARSHRKLFMQLTPWLQNKLKNAMILEAPWFIHLPKFALWAILEATVIVQLVISLQGQVYYSDVADRLCTTPNDLCHTSLGITVAVVIRCVAIGCVALWNFVLVFQGMYDMARMPVSTFRMGRILVQMVGSRQLGLGCDLLLFIMLIFAALKGGWCLSCQLNFLLLGVSVQFSVLIGMGSVLVHPKSNSTDDDILLQVWLQRFAWTEQQIAARIKKRNSLPKDPTLLRDEPMFCLETAVKLLYWCGFVYEHDEGRARLQASEDTAMGLYNLKHLELIRDRLTSTKCLVAWGQDTIVVAFRGTANRQNAVHDIKAWLVPHTAEEEECSSASQGCGISSAAAVHSGFNASWQRGLKKSVCSTIQQAVEQSGSAPGSMQVLITGHSLGGVMAVLAAYDIADLNPWGSLQVYTVGAPRPGNRAFAQQYNAKVPNTWHVINPKDPVPRVGKFWVLYSRPGQRVLVDQGGDLQVRPTPLDQKLLSLNPARQILNDSPLVALGMLHFTFVKALRSHLLVSYRSCFVNIIKAELARPRFEEGLEGVLELANSISLNDLLQAADIDAVPQRDTSLAKEAVVQSVEGMIADAAAVV